jgi:hypothetical protein
VIDTITLQEAIMSATTPLPRWLKPVNAVNVFLLRRGIQFGPPLLLSVPGRQSGRLRTTPVSPVEVGNHRYLVAGFAEADWVKNARTAGWGLIGRGRELERVRLTELPASERAPILKAFVTHVRGGRGFVNVPPKAPLAAFLEVAERFPVFRVEVVAAGR